ncbi:MAG: hypothetical protein BMS9Abin07_1846 [Acidimicrobiia bacterium]|nr:MAG: hypothetical protein BMS9Abin07_1846 [Acidimicrobiia bacterium]
MVTTTARTTVPESAPPRRTLTPRQPVPTWLIVVLVAAPTLLVVLIMSGTLGTIGTGPLIRFPQLLVANTPTGGDMGAHVLLPQILADTLLPSGQILGWSNAWYAGFPVLYFYFPVPALAIVLLDVVLPYGVAFKLVTIAGLVVLPFATYLLVRMLDYSRPIAAVAAIAGGMFLFMESYSIYGGNIKSTLAGEFSFSWSFALSILYLGVVVRDIRQERGWTPLAGILLALTALTHIVPTIIVVLATVPLLLRKNGPRTVVPSWMLGFGIAAFWAVPLGLRVAGGMTTDMGWAPVTHILGDASPGTPLPGEFIPIAVLGGVGMVWAMLRRHDVVALVWLTLLPLAGYFILPRLGVTALYNARLLPFWFFGMFVFAGIALGLAATEVARRSAHRRPILIGGTVLAGLVLLTATIANIHDVPGWVKWNFEGYEGKATYPEYQALMAQIDRLPPGRVMWEANNDMNKYGTPMALMLTGYWSEQHPSMEGLFFESSLTTPFHFLNASEVSDRPSNPVRGLKYNGFDMERGIKHLGVYDVGYYVSFTERGADAAREAGLDEMAVVSPWTIFALPDTDLVDIAGSEPAVWGGGGDFREPSLEWYDDVANLDRWLVETGPAEWRTVVAVEDRLDSTLPYPSTGVVSNVVLEDQRISFTTTAVGVPHLVKVSYFPNWQADGADGPYRAAPSLMVVVPTQENVVLEFRNTAAENIGTALTVFALVGLVAYAYLVRRGRRERERTTT